MEEYNNLDDNKHEELEIIHRHFEYCYHPLIQFVPKLMYAFLWHNYLEEGSEKKINLDFTIDISYIIEAILNGQHEEYDYDLFWDNFLLVVKQFYLDKCRREINIINLQSPSKFVQLWEIGITDPRLENAIINIQKLIRGESPNRKKNVDKGLYLDHINEYKHHNDDDSEKNILLWNPQLIPDIIIDISRQEIDPYLKYLSCEIKDLIGVDPLTLRESKEVWLHYKLKAKTFDFFFKMEIVQKYVLGSRDEDREYRNLKFVDIYYKIKDQKKQSVYKGRSYPKEEDIKIFFTRYIHLSKDILKKIIDMTERSTSAYGQQLLKKFANLDIEKLTVDDLKKWSLDVLNEVFDHRTYRFLNNEITPDIIKNGMLIVNDLRQKL